MEGEQRNPERQQRAAGQQNRKPTRRRIRIFTLQPARRRIVDRARRDQQRSSDRENAEGRRQRENRDKAISIAEPTRQRCARNIACMVERLVQPVLPRKAALMYYAQRHADERRT